jgi:DNA-binding SARP family transcriptional activator/predicted ATPase/Tfp pilus assembly protein PilF
MVLAAQVPASPADDPVFARLLGPVELRAAGRAVRFGPERRCQLLACMAVRAGSWVERDQLAALFWPQRDLADARHNLRKVIHTARELPGAQGLEASPHALRWQVQTDLALLHQGRLDLLREDGAGWRGQALSGLDDTGNPAWTEWLAHERTRALALWQQATQRRLHTLEEPREREALAQRLLEADPFDEIAARAVVQALVHVGRPAEAQRFYDAFVQRLRSDLAVEPSLALRDLAASAVRAMGAPAARSMPAPPGPGPAAFVGRRLELRQIVQQLGTERCRALVLVGPGGIGKSRLAREAVPALAGYFGAGVHWVELDDLQDLSAAVARVAHVMGVTLADRGDVADSLLRGLPGAPLLLVLDNAEHLPGLPALLQRLLSGCTTLQLLITSRERLRLEGERLLALEGLEVPDGDSRDAEAAVHFDAVELFLRDARSARPDFDARPHIDAVVGVVELLGGMPLAIQMAAAWVRLLPPEAILRQLQGPEHSLDVLEADPASALPLARPAHTSLRRVIEQSWARLVPREAEALADLAVFAGGFQSDAARVVGHVSLPVLATLVDRSLLTVSDTGRFALHPVLAVYAAERLALTPEREAALRNRHADFYCRQLLALAPHARGRQRLLIQGVNADYANAHAAWTHAVASGRAELVTGAVNVWRIYYEVQGRLAEGFSALQPALQLAAQGMSARRAGAAVRHALAMLTLRLGRLDEARALAEASIADGEWLEDVGAQTGGWIVMGQCAQSAGQAEAARDAFQRALACARAAGDAHGVATATGNLGIVEKRLGHHEVALSLYREALAAERLLENQLQVALLLNNIAALQLSRGEHAGALQSIAEGREHCRRHGVTLLLPYLALNEGVVALEQGRFADARQPLEESLAAAAQAGQRPLELSALIGLARADTGCGDTAAALRTLARVAATARGLGLVVLLADCVGCAGEALLQQGRAAQAARCLAVAMAQASADATARERWKTALEALPGDMPAAAPGLFEECLTQLIAGRFG